MAAPEGCRASRQYAAGRMRLQNSREASAPVPDCCWLQTLPDDYGKGFASADSSGSRLLELFAMC